MTHQSLFNDAPNNEESTIMSQEFAEGWYPTPDKTAERFYNGTTWTDSYRTPGAAVAVEAGGSPTAVVTVGYVMAVIIPIVGFIMGLVLLGNNNPANKKHAGWTIIASVVAFVVWLAILNSGNNSGSGSSY